MTTTLATSRTVPGRAGELLARLGDRAVLCDMYDATGSEVYHDLAGGNTLEIRELLAAIRPFPGPVLDLAAGSGRLTFPLLAAGRPVTALELSPDMLRLLHARLAGAPASLRGRCDTVQADMSDFSLGRRYAVVVLGTTTVSLLDAAGRAGLYRAVRDHLAPGGRFLLSTVDLDPADAGPAEAELLHVTESGRRYRMFEHWVAGSGTRTVTVFPAEPGASGPVPVCTTSINVLPVAVLEEELDRAGFAVRSRIPLTGAGERHHDVLLEAEALR
ncbi:daptide-type RiPP biosynthesis methyltransferase [Streptomyces flavidovirens]|uniref:Daptide-type RiPP biosynthesis methyltransferase n=1 Tax=Streptomyces flavidovirens TaxID=67298 RepID=A0ABW6RCA3_9ACTN